MAQVVTVHYTINSTVETDTYYCERSKMQGWPGGLTKLSFTGGTDADGAVDDVLYADASRVVRRPDGEKSDVTRTPRRYAGQ